MIKLIFYLASEAVGLPVWRVVIWSLAIAKFYPARRVALG